MVSCGYRLGKKIDRAREEEGWAWRAAGYRSPVGFAQRVLHGARAELWVGERRREAS